MTVAATTRVDGVDRAEYRIAAHELRLSVNDSRYRGALRAVRSPAAAGRRSGRAALDAACRVREPQRPRAGSCRHTGARDPTLPGRRHLRRHRVALHDRRGAATARLDEARLRCAFAARRPRAVPRAARRAPARLRRRHGGPRSAAGAAAPLRRARVPPRRVREAAMGGSAWARDDRARRGRRRPAPGCENARSGSAPSPSAAWKAKASFDPRRTPRSAIAEDLDRRHLCDLAEWRLRKIVRPGLERQHEDSTWRGAALSDASICFMTPSSTH